LFAGATHVTVACALPAVATTEVGAFDAPTGVTAFDGADVGELPYTLVAVTVKVYEVPFVSPVTVQVKAPVVVQV
jgi:hypothetical protein